MRAYCPAPTGRWSVGDLLQVEAVADVAPETASDTAVTAVTDQFGESIAPELGAAMFGASDQPDDGSLLREWITEAIRRERHADLPSRFTAVRVYDTPVSGPFEAPDTEFLVVTVTAQAGPFYPAHLEVATPAELLAGAKAYWAGVPAGGGPREYLLTQPAPIVAIESAGEQHTGE